ncbi:MAG TPA: DMT family transporter [Steroidobacteraceae bacterium]|jgi:drug/metabolite transporter (DMT)-like permease|nr:DMT family transporter [Steroidobacteraceae bacterium]
MFEENTASILILVSGAAHAVVNAVLKAGHDKMSRRALIDGFSAVLLAPAAFLVPLPANAWNWLIASAVVHGLYLFALIKSFEQSDMTVAYPIARGLAPMLAAAGAVAIFHEPISAAVVFGILGIATGVMFIGVSHKLKRTALAWAVLTGICIASYTVIDAQGVRAAPTALSYIVWTFLLLGGGLGTFFAVWRGRSFFVAAAGQWKPGLMAGALSIVTYGLALLAFRFGATPRLAALRETSILFGTAIAVVFLKERLTRLRFAGVLAIAAGAMILIAAR